MRPAAAVRSVVPEPVRERVRLRFAAALERRQRRSDAVRAAAVVFHAVAPRAGDPDFEVDPALPTDRLGEIAAYLSRRYRLVRAGELPAAARDRRAGEPVPVAVTFDDDLPSHRDQALPALAGHGVVATAFLCGTAAPFWWQLLQRAIDTRAIAADSLPGVSAALVAPAIERRPRAIRRLAQAIEELAPRSAGRRHRGPRRGGRTSRPLSSTRMAPPR